MFRPSAGAPEAQCPSGISNLVRQPGSLKNWATTIDQTCSQNSRSLRPYISRACLSRFPSRLASTSSNHLQKHTTSAATRQALVRLRSSTFQRQLPPTPVPQPTTPHLQQQWPPALPRSRTPSSPTSTRPTAPTAPSSRASTMPSPGLSVSLPPLWPARSPSSPVPVSFIFSFLHHSPLPPGETPFLPSSDGPCRYPNSKSGLAQPSECQAPAARHRRPTYLGTWSAFRPGLD
ncbi:hypothetical protein GQ53DRAFT_101009 [Thozetella sp. PMI_491]|nr:hypothetical protein GQ53DRAFT_101009 [Thozetella sp. PMI_491]